VKDEVLKFEARQIAINAKAKDPKNKDAGTAVVLKPEVYI